MRRPSVRKLLPPSIVLASLAALMVGACDPITDVRGHAPTPGAMEKLEVGSQTREDVLRLIGSPSSIANFGDDTWYYISQRQEAVAFFQPKTTEQKVTAISFGDNGRIKEIKTFDRADAKDPGMVPRATPTVGKELTVLEQIFGNIGRFGGAGSKK
jgi:outer membrane protein assembly factor BamE (lipoprotein component of BamABCDE complex)